MKLVAQIVAVVVLCAGAIPLLKHLDREHERNLAHSSPIAPVNTVLVSPMGIARAFQIATSLVPGTTAHIDDHASSPYTHRLSVFYPADANPGDVEVLRDVATTLPMQRCGIEVIFLEEVPEPLDP